MIGTYVGNAPIVRAAQLTEESADVICRWTLGYRLGPDRWIPMEGCWRVSALRWYATPAGGTWTTSWYPMPPNALIVGLRTRQGEQIAVEGDWLVQGVGGAFAIVNPGDFGDLYQPTVETVEARS